MLMWNPVVRDAINLMKEEKSDWEEMEERVISYTRADGEVQDITIPRGCFVQDPGLLRSYVFPYFTRHKKWTVHVILILSLVLYTILGAILIINLESVAEIEEIKDSRKQKDELLQKLWREGASHENKSKTHFQDHFINTFIENGVFSDQVWDNENPTTQWSFARALQFCASCYLTWGFGDLYPITTGGRVFVILYSLFGIPFMLYILNDFADMVVDTIGSFWKMIRRLYFTGIFFNRNVVTRPPVSSLQSYIYWLELCTISFGSKPIPSLKKQKILTVEQYLASEQEYKFRMPVSLGILLVNIYIFSGAYILTFIEDWNFLESTYFVFIMMTTIGFGDYYVTNEPYIPPFIVCAILGMSLMTVLLNCIQDKVTDIRSSVTQEAEKTNE